MNAPGEIRTPDLRFRRPTLYPAELRALMCFLPANPALPVATTPLVPMPLPGTETRQYRRICARESPAGTKSLRMTLGKDNAGNLARPRGAGSRNGVGGFASARAGLPAGGRAVEDLRAVARDRDLDCGGMLAADGGDAVEAQPDNRRLRTRCSRCCARQLRRQLDVAPEPRLKLGSESPRPLRDGRIHPAGSSGVRSFVCAGPGRCDRVEDRRAVLESGADPPGWLRGAPSFCPRRF